MMMLPNKKSAATIIIEKIKKPEMEKPSEEMVNMESPEQDYQLAMEDAAKKMIDSINSKDAKMFVQHLMDFLDMKKEAHESSEEE